MARPINIWRLAKAKNMQIGVLTDCVNRVESNNLKGNLASCVNEFKSE